MMARPGVIAKKLGMTSFMTEDGAATPATLFSLEGCCVVSKQHDQEGGNALLQVGSGIRKKASKPLSGHFSKNDVEPRAELRTFRVHPEHELPTGTLFQADYFPEGSYVDVAGVTIGRGFAGAMKRHGFKGLRASHGVSVSHRSHGSTGHRKDPGRVFKGKKMAGHMGCVRVTVQNLKVLHTDIERGIIVVNGNVPGFEGGWVTLCDAVKKHQQNIPAHTGVKAPSPKAEKKNPSEKEGESHQRVES
jgi:large subunit ribosomal protein L3